MQKHFKDLPHAQVGVQSDLFPPPTLPSLATLALRHTFLKQGMYSSATDLEIENAALKCKVIRLDKIALSTNSEMNLQKSSLSAIEDRLQHETESNLRSKEEHRMAFDQQRDALTSCQQELSDMKSRCAMLCEQEENAKETNDSMVAQFRSKIDQLSSTLSEKETEIEAAGRKLSETLAEMAIVEESFRLFKNSVLTSIDEDGKDESETSSKLMMKVRVLQESNAQLSAEVKSYSRQCADCEVEVAAVREQLSLSDRMKLRLSATVSHQTDELGVLEQKLQLANQLALQEQAAREQDKEVIRELELRAIQDKFTNDRLEHTLVDMKETIQGLEDSLAKQKLENKRWVDRMRSVEESATRAQEIALRELSMSFDRDLQQERARLTQKEEECTVAQTLLSAAEHSLLVANGDKKELQLRVTSLEAQAEHLLEAEDVLSALQTDLEGKEDEIATLCDAFEKRGETIKGLETRISLQASEISFLRPERDSKAKIMKDFEGQLDALRKENAELLRVSYQNDNRGSVIDELKMTVSQYEQELKHITNDKDKLSHSNSELDLLKSDYRVLKDRFVEVEETMAELSEAAAEEIQQRETTIASLKEVMREQGVEKARMQETMQGLMQEKEQLEKAAKKKEEEEEEAAAAAAAAGSSMFSFRS